MICITVPRFTTAAAQKLFIGARVGVPVPEFLPIGVVLTFVILISAVFVMGGKGSRAFTTFPKKLLATEYKLTKRLRQRLRRPLGKIIESERPTLREVSPLIADSVLIATVGDASTKNLIRIGIIPSIQIVDGWERREKRKLPRSAQKAELRARNPAGVITRESLNVLKGAFTLPRPVRILVDGEEDLLTLPLLAMSPEGSVIFYGQPKKGLVAVKVNKRRKERAKKMLRELGIGIVNDAL